MVEDVPYTIITPIEQTTAEPLNFVGDAYYYDLTKKEVYPALHGEYVVVYTRFISPNEKPFVFPPSLVKKFTIITQKGGAVTTSIREVKEALGAGYVGVGEYHHNGHHLELKINRISNDPLSRSKTEATLEVKELQTYIPHTNGKDSLGKLLELGVPEKGSTIRFGLKEMDHEETEQGRVAYYGFNFAELRLNCFHPHTGKPGHQLVVAVKLPKKDDVASSKILDQKILLALDVWILDRDERGREMACYEHTSMAGWR